MIGSTHGGHERQTASLSRPPRLALPEEALMARPTGVGRAITTYTLPIEGRDEWLDAARRQA
jgi:hypothetical protein